MKKRRRSKSWGKKLVTPAVYLVAVVLIVAVARITVDWSSVTGGVDHFKTVLTTHPYFAVKEITVTGNKKIGGSEIVALTGLRPGVNIWKVDPARVEANLNRHPWIRGQVVRREFPQRVIIQIEEWKTKGIVVLEKLYYANAEGIVFKAVELGEKTNLPFITGLGKERTDLDDHRVRNKISEALTLSEIFSKHSMAVSEIQLRAEGGVIAYPLAHRVPLHMGWGNWTRKVGHLKRVWTEWKGRENILASLDMSFRGQVVVKWRGRTNAG
ncbi:MAG: FtsQ-type POTRA domain-containing protein [Deltaproteobacteria bacterium]|nr:FtsQ-type POTRA domain-containing protein [Deltaproteobacteria bacterium]